MNLIIDDANVLAIRKIYEYYPIDGVTTNPSILAKTGRPPFEVLKAIRLIIGPDKELHAQAVSPKAEGMVEEAHRIVKELGDSTFVKIPAIEEGYKAMKILHKEGIRVTATVIYNEMQGFLSGLAGADYAAPYVNRITKLGGDGIKVACDIQDFYDKNNLSCKVLGASFKQKDQVLSLCRHGVGAVTIPVDLFYDLVNDSNVDAAVAAFLSDFEGLVGEGNNMLNCK